LFSPLDVVPRHTAAPLSQIFGAEPNFFWRRADNMAMRLRLFILVTGLVGISAVAQAQISNGGIQVSGRIPKMVSLALSSTDTMAQPVASSTDGNGQVRLRLQQVAGVRTITATFLARSNTAYRLRAISSAVQRVRRAQPLRTRVTSVDVNGGGSWVMPDAKNVIFSPAEFSESADEGTLLQGPRISRGGNNATVDNALRITLEIQLPEESTEEEILVKMEPAD
jgi:hypothetical protein